MEINFQPLIANGHLLNSVNTANEKMGIKFPSKGKTGNTHHDKKDGNPFSKFKITKTLDSVALFFAIDKNENKAILKLYISNEPICIFSIHRHTGAV